MTTVKITVEYTVGQTVHLKHRQERLPGVVVGLVARPTGVAYIIAWGDATESSHYDLELTDLYDVDYDPS